MLNISLNIKENQQLLKQEGCLVHTAR